MAVVIRPVDGRSDTGPTGLNLGEVTTHDRKVGQVVAEVEFRYSYGFGHKATRTQDVLAIGRDGLRSDRTDIVRCRVS